MEEPCDGAVCSSAAERSYIGHVDSRYVLGPLDCTAAAGTFLWPAIPAAPILTSKFTAVHV